MLNGAIAGVAARTTSAPLDLLKIRFQLQNTSARQYTSIIGSIRTVFYEEGLSGFWKGNMAGIYLYACYSAVQFGIYEELKKYVNKVTKDAFFYRFQGAMGKGGIGAVAAMGGTLISYPFDLIRTRHSLQKSAPSQYRYYKSIIPTIQTIIREEGIRGLYKGIGPSLAQVVPYMGIVFATFEKSKSILLSTSLSEHPTNLLSGIVSGFLSKLIMMPVDVVRKRMQIQGSYYNAYVLKGLPIYSDLLDCIRGIWRVEGGRGFFSGLSFALLKSVPATATTFVVYGLIKNM